jgi:hypothetical protein
MTTRQTTDPPTVATISAGHRYAEDGTRRHHVRISQTPSTPLVFIPADDYEHAVRLARILRGVLAEAFTAGAASTKTEE